MRKTGFTALLISVLILAAASTGYAQSTGYEWLGGSWEYRIDFPGQPGAFRYTINFSKSGNVIEGMLSTNGNTHTQVKAFIRDGGLQWQYYDQYDVTDPHWRDVSVSVTPDQRQISYRMHEATVVLTKK
jgi:hypothetical protein